ncbi:MAG: phosphate acyltransferase PlsX [Mycoplasmoidaceae bacterium]|nr:MAG: phosphate acyltransferase PlsX [Mycoplasmoidaceae bacterium]
MKLVFDIMGGDSKPEELLYGVRSFQKLHKDVDMILVGDETEIKKSLKKKDKFTIINAKNILHTGDPVHKILRDTDSSMYKSLTMVDKNEADGMLTVGSTPAYVMLSFYIIKTIPGINKGAFMSYVPTATGNGFMFLDVGANLVCSAQDLVQFGKMGNIYLKEVMKIDNPKINILNIGTEDNKGFEFQQQAHKLLQADKTLNYQGFIESRELTLGLTDIVVCDGYTGNVALKALEGCLLSINKLMKKEFKKIYNLPGAILSLGVIKKIKKTFDYKNHAGAFVVGLRKNICKTHGNAKREEVFSSLEMLYNAVKFNLVEKIQKNINE